MSEVYVGAVMLLLAGAIVATYAYTLTREQHNRNLQLLSARRTG